MAFVLIVVGILIAGSGIYISSHRFPFSLEMTSPDGLGHMVFINPGPELVMAVNLTYLVILLGIIVAGLGLYQLLRQHLRPDAGRGE